MMRMYGADREIEYEVHLPIQLGVQPLEQLDLNRLAIFSGKDMAARHL